MRRITAPGLVTRRGDSKGQSLVEFALIAPAFLLMLIGVFDVGRVVWANNSLANAAREGARFAIAHGGSASTPCPVGPAVPRITVIPAASTSCPYPSPSTQSIKDRALEFAIAGGTGTTVTVCYGLNCSGNTHAANATNARGTPVTVRVSSSLTLVAGTFFGLGNFTINGESTMVVSH